MRCSVCGSKMISNTASYNCPTCGHNIPYTNSLVNEPDNKPGGLYGWICPKCGAVLSPFVDCCPNCTQRNWTITCNTGGNLT